MTPQPDELGFRVITKRGHVIEVSSESELEAVARVLGLKPDPPLPPRLPRAERLAPERSLLLVLKELARRDKPMNTAQVADLAGLRAAKGLAAQSRVWSKILGAHGLDLDDAIKRFRDHDSYWWSPGPKLKAAVEALEGPDEA